MKKRLLKVLCLLFFCTKVFSLEVISDWEDLPPFGDLTKEEWNSILLKRGNELKNITVSYNDDSIGVWFLEHEPEYKVKGRDNVKRAVIVVESIYGFQTALCFETPDAISEKTVYSNPYFFGVQGYAIKGKLCLIMAIFGDRDIVFGDLEYINISYGAFEWPKANYGYIRPFYYWNETDKRIYIVDIYNENFTSYFVPVKNPVFYYSSEENEDGSRSLYVSSTDGKSDTPLPNSKYELKDGKVLW